MPPNQLHYRGRGAEDPMRMGHTIESRALLVILAILPGNRKLKAASKAVCLQLLMELIRSGVASMGGVPQDELSFNFFDSAGQPHAVDLKFNEAGMTTGLRALLERHSKAAQTWSKLTNNQWHQMSLTSSMGLASLWDVFLWSTWAKHNSAVGNIWADICQSLWPALVFCCGDLLEKFALKMASLAPQPLPLLKSKNNKTRRLPRVNKLLLLERLRMQKRHRQETMKSHTDLTSGHATLVVQEKGIECCIYLKNLLEEFAETRQLMVSWDESTYDIPTLVCCVFDWRVGKGGFLPIQCMNPILIRELDDDIQELCLAGKATRLDTYKTIRALSHALEFLGLPLSTFQVPADVRVGPLQAEEERTWTDGCFMTLA